MVDLVALASVLSSGTVALGGLWLSYRQSRLQLDHEFKLAYEERVWAEKAPALLRVVDAASRLADAAWQVEDRDDEQWASFAVTAMEVASALDVDVMGRINVFASEEARITLEQLRLDLRRLPIAAIRDYAEAAGRRGDADAATDEPVRVALARLQSAAANLRDEAILDPSYARRKSLELVHDVGIDVRRPVL
jgi:hypothetical protein